MVLLSAAAAIAICFWLRCGWGRFMVGFGEVGVEAWRWFEGTIIFFGDAIDSGGVGGFGFVSALASENLGILLVGTGAAAVCW